MFQTFVYWSGAIADRVVAALCDRARAGVDVRVLLDGFGAKPMPDRLVTSMRAAGIDVRWFRPLSVWRLGRVDNRSHRRILVIDDTIGFTGGVGIAAEWEGDAENPAHWRDNHFKCLGPCISGLSAAFLHNWLETGFDLVPALVAETVPAKAGDLCVQVVASTGSSVIPAAAIMQEALVSLAQQQIRIVTAYFAPSDHLVGAIIEAVRRGVEVEIIIPGPHIDKRVSELAGAEAFLPLLENGVTIWRYQPTMLHAKVITVDGVISCVGSPNFNQRSTGKDDEIALNVLSPEFCRILNEDFEADRAQCEKTTISDWRHRSLPRRIAEAVLSPFKPQT